jgi:hypothetical protein
MFQYDMDGKRHTWSNRPGLGTREALRVITGNSMAWVEFDVTGYIQAERAAGRSVVTLAPYGTANTTDYYKAHSKENASNNKPTLRVTTSN